MSAVRVSYQVLLSCRRVSHSSASSGLVARGHFSRAFCTASGKGSDSKSNGRTNGYLIGAGIAVATVGGYVLFNRPKSGGKDAAKKGGDVKEETKKQLIPDLPGSIKYLLIGGGASSFAAFRSIRGADPKAKVIVITEENHEPYMKPPLSKELWFSERSLVENLKFRQWNGRERSVYYEHPEFYMDLKKLQETETGGVSIVKGYKVVELNPVLKRAVLDNGQSIHYDKCLIATGGKPKSTKVFDDASPEIKNRVLLYHNIDDFLKLRKLSDTKSTITIVGGGFLGSELACALGRRAQLVEKPLRVYQVFPESGNLSKVLPGYLSQWTTSKIRGEGAEVIPNVDVKSVKKFGDKLTLELTNGQSLETDYVVLSVGLEPNVDLAKSAGLEVDENLGGFRVNSELQARSEIWIAGDVSCFYDVKLGRRRVEHHDHAVRTGRLAGENMTGAGKHYWHQSMFWSDLGPDIGFEAIGLIDSALPTVGVFAKSSESQADPASDSKEKTPDASSESSKSEQPKLRSPADGDTYDRGIIFYLRDKVIVGIVLWNIFDRMAIARRILNEGKVYDDMSEVAKLFNLRSIREEDLEEPPEDLPKLE